MPDGARAPLPYARHASAAATARNLLGAPLDWIEPVASGGRNSRVYRVRCGGASFALKHYPPDRRDRLKTETEALALMVRHGVTAAPRVLATDPERGYALLEWIDGKPVDRPSAPDIDAAAGFLIKIHALRQVREAEHQPLAAEACLSGAEIAAQLEGRLERLGGVAGDDAALARFLVRLSEGLATSILPRAVAGYDRLGLSFAVPIAADARSLCPSDFGFHNALRGPRGLFFVDFEYFGWDDPAKLVCDFLLHPGTPLAAPLKARFVAAMRAAYGGDPHFGERLRLLYPMFAMRWCLILLNEFLPERWAGRRHAGADGDWDAAKRRQLAKATALFEVTRTESAEWLR
ncbi:MAG TPA: aminoglycoside phosphotransferase family protein [Stellaceae bacterium]|nr:aminoglycoside phosphotransferase family protein [Stellaceae bacterium]